MSKPLLPVVEKPDYLPVGQAIFEETGQHVHQSTQSRWCSHGVRGRKLHSIMFGGIRMTRREWVRSFIDVDSLSSAQS